MPQKLASFIKEFSSGQNSDLVQKFKSDPRATMTAAGIQKSHQALILSGDSKGLTSALKGGAAGAAADDLVVVVVIAP
jgi:hypothetical protein